jgi:Domain of unknown function (DUF6398)
MQSRGVYGGEVEAPWPLEWPHHLAPGSVRQPRWCYGNVGQISAYPHSVIPVGMSTWPDLRGDNAACKQRGPVPGCCYQREKIELVRTGFYAIPGTSLAECGATNYQIDATHDRTPSFEHATPVVQIASRIVVLLIRALSMTLPARSNSVPKLMLPVYEKIVGSTDDVCDRHLNPEYRALARAMTAALCRKRPSPLAAGQPRTWACGIVYVLGRINFPGDPSFSPHMATAELCAVFEVGESTVHAKARAHRKGGWDPSDRSRVDASELG